MHALSVRSFLALCLVFVAGFVSSNGAPLARLASPDGSVVMTVEERADGALEYDVRLGRRNVIETSPLRFTVDGVELTRGVELVNQKSFTVNDTYPWRGGHAVATNHFKGQTLFLRHKASGVAYSLELRAFNDGAAFRYVVAGDDKARTPDENDGFNLPKGSTIWYHGENGHYEDVYKTRMLSEMQAGEWAMPPVTYKLPRNGGYAYVTEAALANFSGMALQANGSNGFNLVLAHAQPASYPYRLRYTTNDVLRLSKPATVMGTIVTPWRVVVVGRDLNTLVNSDIIQNLCPPPDPEIFPQGFATSWVKPGRAVWKYLDGGESTLQGAKEFSRIAGELGFEYNIIEGYWSRWSDEEIRDLVSYARKQNVGLWFWKHSRGLRTAEEREAFFRKLHDFGVVGAKIDFLDHEHKEVIDLYQALLADAARHQIMLNFHGANKPTGEPRTWPNELTREAVKGMEASKLADRATHDVILPFTRYLVGHGNYTVMHFGARRTNTTWAHQIASAAILDDPLQTYAANPRAIQTNPAVEIIKAIPVVWDETKVLPPSEIGEVAVFARRSGEDWFLAIMNGTNSRTLQLPLSFLEKRKYAATLVRDDPPNSAAVKVEKAAVARGDKLKIELSSGGGFIAHITAADAPRVFMLNGEVLLANGKRVRAGDKALSPALAELEEDAQRLLGRKPPSVTDKTQTPPSGDKRDYMSLAPYFWPNPETPNGLPYIRRDGERNPEINRISDHENILGMPEMVETLALAWYFTGDERYAEKAAEFLRVWFLDPATRMNPHFQYAQAIKGVNTGRGIGLIESRGLVHVVDAVGLLASSKTWSARDQRGMEEWFGEFLDWMLKSKNGRDEAAAKNNHGTYYDVQITSFALFLDRRKLALDTVQAAKQKRIAVQIEPDGSQPLELVRTKAWGYSIGNLSGLMSLARLGENVGVDLWSYETSDGRGIRRAIDYLSPYAFGESKWPYQQLGGFSGSTLHSVLRRAAEKYPDERYQVLRARIPAANVTSRSQLTRPTSAPIENGG